MQWLQSAGIILELEVQFPHSEAEAAKGRLTSLAVGVYDVSFQSCNYFSYMIEQMCKVDNSNEVLLLFFF